MTEGGDDIYTHIILGIEHRVPIVELRGDMRSIFCLRRTLFPQFLLLCAHTVKKNVLIQKKIYVPLKKTLSII